MTWSALLANITLFIDQLRSRLISQLSEVISIVVQKLLRYFNGNIVSTFFVTFLPVSPVIFYLILNESVVALSTLKSVIAFLAAKSGSSL